MRLTIAGYGGKDMEKIALVTGGSRGIGAATAVTGHVLKKVVHHQSSSGGRGGFHGGGGGGFGGGGGGGSHGF